MIRKLVFSLFTAVFLCGVLSAQSSQIKVIPKPSEVNSLGTIHKIGNFNQVYLDPAAGLCPGYIAELLTESGICPTFVTNEKKANIVFKINSSPAANNEEAYKLWVMAPEYKNKIVATADSGKGLHYAIQTLRQLTNISPEGITVPACVITDAPTFSWRAFMLDESRHFCGTFLVKNLLDEMARLKMNIFHWHLVDDPGWRIEIKKYPLLTEIGSKRDYSHLNMTPEDYSAHFPQRQYYTQEEIKDIVDYASRRGITIMPEIEVPGHASAAIYSYPWLGAMSKNAETPVWGDLYNVVDPKVEQFLKDVLDEVIELFPSKIVHIGGDEAHFPHWANAPEVVQFMEKNNIPTYMDLQLWIINRMSQYLESKGCRMMGWNEITGENIREEEHVEASQATQLAPGTIVHFWDGSPELINKALDKGYDVVNSYRFFTYLDYGYETTPFEKAYSFQPIPDGISEADKSKIKGIGCQSWGEFTPNSVKLFYQIFPRIATFSETGWTPYEDKNFEDFRERFKPLEKIWKEKGYLGPQLHKY